MILCQIYIVLYLCFNRSLYWFLNQMTTCRFVLHKKCRKLAKRVWILGSLVQLECCSLFKAVLRFNIFFLIKKRNSLNLWFIINSILNFLSHIVIIIFWFIFRLQKDMKHYKSMWPCFSVSDGLYMYLILNMNKLWTKLNWKLKKTSYVIDIVRENILNFSSPCIKSIYRIFHLKFKMESKSICPTSFSIPLMHRVP